MWGLIKHNIVVSTMAKPVPGRSLKLSNNGQGSAMDDWPSIKKLQSLENQMCPKSKTRVLVTPEMILHWSTGFRQ